MSDYDVVVVGGGCAGLWASRTAALAGARTLLVEKNPRIGEKILCAEGIGAAGIGQMLEPAQEWVAASIDRALLFGPDGECVEIDEAGCGYVLKKEVFLLNLAAAAAAAGAETRLGTEVEDVTPSGDGGLTVHLGGGDGGVSIGAGAVVAADGIESRIGRRVGIQKALQGFELFSCAQYRLGGVDLRPGTVELYFGRDVAPGAYAWVFPKGEDIANVGVGVICSGKNLETPLEYLDRFRRRRCPGAEMLGRVFGGVPSAKSPFRICGHGVFAAGDAARVADPVSGAGIVPGMESAEIAASAAVAYAGGVSGRNSVEREFVRKMKTLLKDRSLRFAVRKILVKMTDEEISRMLALVGEYASQASLIGGDPFSVVRFMLKAMPRTFGLVRHLVGV